MPNMNLFNILKRRNNKFLSLLVEQASLTVSGLDLLKGYLKKRNSSLAQQVMDAEMQADEVRNILIDELKRAFITPINREDIFNLSRKIDDVLDYASTTVEEMEILDVAPTPFMIQMASLLHESAQEILLAVQRLQDDHPAVAADHAQRAKGIENQVETVYREALADLFSGPKSFEHVVVMFKSREVYRHLSNAADREDDAANVIADIVMKMG